MLGVEASVAYIQYTIVLDQVTGDSW